MWWIVQTWRGIVAERCLYDSNRGFEGESLLRRTSGGCRLFRRFSLAWRRGLGLGSSRRVVGGIAAVVVVVWWILGGGVV